VALEAYAEALVKRGFASSPHTARSRRSLRRAWSAPCEPCHSADVAASERIVLLWDGRIQPECLPVPKPLNRRSVSSTAPAPPRPVANTARSIPSRRPRPGARRASQQARAIRRGWSRPSRPKWKSLSTSTSATATATIFLCTSIPTIWYGIGLSSWERRPCLVASIRVASYRRQESAATLNDSVNHARSGSNRCSASLAPMAISRPRRSHRGYSAEATIFMLFRGPPGPAATRTESDIQAISRRVGEATLLAAAGLTRDQQDPAGEEILIR
jgi:hypothetical protein